MAKSDKARTSALRNARLAAGWTEVRVWAASKDDVQAIRKFSEEIKMKRLYESTQQIGHERKTLGTVVERALAALQLQGSPAYITPSGATLDFISDLARAEQLDDISTVVQMFAQAYPGNAHVVAASVPAKVLNYYIEHQLDLRSTSHILTWQAAHPDWAAEMQTAMHNFSLQAWADAAIRQIQAIA